MRAHGDVHVVSVWCPIFPQIAHLNEGILIEAAVADEEGRMTPNTVLETATDQRMHRSVKLMTLLKLRGD